MTHLSRGDSSDDECVILNVSDDDDDGFAPARAAPVLPAESVEDTLRRARCDGPSPKPFIMDPFTISDANGREPGLWLQDAWGLRAPVWGSMPILGSKLASGPSTLVSSRLSSHSSTPM